MLVTTKAIVLNAIRYQEKSLIVRCFTREYGIKSYFIRGAFGKGRKAPYFQPINILDLQAFHKDKGNLESIREVSLSFCYQTLSSQMLKSSLAVFIAEVLYHAIKEEQPNKPFFDFLEAAFKWLDNHDETANFHLVLLLQATRYLGFYPDTSEINLPFFDLKEGRFSNSQTISCTSPENTCLLQKLLKVTFETESKIFSNLQRKVLLKTILDYYQIHLDGFVRPRSLEVFQEVFATP